jgi:uncharacterized membrane-anchored protein YjiN (DUF445 family)
MSEEILSNEERNAILGQVFNKSGQKENASTPKKSSVLSESVTDLSQLSFGELLERTLEHRKKLDEEDNETQKRIDESRADAIRNSRMDILKDFKL